jgi:hypothetical protein
MEPSIKCEVVREAVRYVHSVIIFVNVREQVLFDKCSRREKKDWKKL